MDDRGYLGKALGRCNRNLLILNILLVVTIVAAIAAFADWRPFLRSWGGAIALGGVVFGVWNIRKSLQRRQLSNHPVIQELERFGQVDAIAREIDSQAATSDARKLSRTVTLTPSWLLIRSVFSIKMLHVSELVWVYVKATKRSVNFVPTGTGHEVVVQNIHGWPISINCTKREAAEVCASIQGYAQWIIAGYDEEIDERWNKNRAELIASVRARCKENVSECRG